MKPQSADEAAKMFRKKSYLGCCGYGNHSEDDHNKELEDFIRSTWEAGYEKGKSDSKIAIGVKKMTNVTDGSQNILFAPEEERLEGDSSTRINCYKYNRGYRKTMTLSYELCKKLKDTGFDFDFGAAVTADSLPPQSDFQYQPTLSELIEAVMSINKGKNFGFYSGGDAPFTAWKRVTFENNGNDYRGEGDTPEEAVANLWLALTAK